MLIQKFGWANRKGAGGFSAGIYDEKKGNSRACKLAPRSGLEEVIKQGMNLVLSKKTKGIVCGREFTTGVSLKGEKNLVIKTEWMQVELAAKDMDSCRMTLTLPFDEDGESSGQFALPVTYSEEEG